MEQAELQQSGSFLSAAWTSHGASPNDWKALIISNYAARPLALGFPCFLKVSPPAINSVDEYGPGHAGTKTASSTVERGRSMSIVASLDFPEAA